MRADGRAYVLLDGASGVLVLPVAAELPLALLVGRRVVVAGDDAATWLVVGLTGTSVLNVAHGLLQLDATGKVADGLLSTAVARLNTAQTWTAEQRFDEAVGVGVAPLATIGLRINKAVTDPTAATNGMNGVVLATLTANNAQSVVGFGGSVQINPGGFVASGAAVGLQAQARMTGAGTLAEATALYGRVQANTAGGTITTGTTVYADTPAATGTIATQYGLYVARQKAGATVTTGFGVFVAHAADHNHFAGNVGIGTTNGWGGGVGVLALANAQTVPASNPSGGGVLYVQGGALRFRGSGGTVTTIAPA